ncbi:MAG: Tn3 family transposase [Enterococcus faecalis]|nr:Tn3 family transposase [Enterococcus faecalis]
MNKGVSIYTHINDQYSPIYTQLISSSEEAAHIIDGILYNTSEKEIEEHFTDSAGYAYQVFGLCQLLGIRFSPRIKRLEKRTLYSLQELSNQSPLRSMYGGKINTSVIKECWDDLLRLGYSVRTRTVSASQILKKLASYPRQNKLALALRVHQGGEIYGQSYENQLNRANGLNLLMSMIVLWNTGHIEEIVHQQQSSKEPIPEEYLKHISPLGWQHIVITGDYIWKRNVTKR